MDTNLDPNELLNVDPALTEAVKAKVQEHSSGIGDAVADGPGGDMLESVMDGAGDVISGISSAVEGVGEAISGIFGSIFD